MRSKLKVRNAEWVPGFASGIIRAGLVLLQYISGFAMIYWGVELGVTSWNKLAVPILQFPQVNFTLLLLSLFSFVAVGFLLKDTFRFSLIENNLENKDLINIVSSRAIVLVAGASLNFLINTIYI